MNHMSPDEVANIPAGYHLTLRALDTLSLKKPGLDLDLAWGVDLQASQGDVLTEQGLWDSMAWCVDSDSPYEEVNFVFRVKCCSRCLGTPISNMVLVFFDWLQEQGRPLPTHEIPPAPRVQGERVIDQLLEWIRSTGPKRRNEIEAFLWRRAHGSMPDLVEVLEASTDHNWWFRPYAGSSKSLDYRLRLIRPSDGFWATNIQRYVGDGRLTRIERGLYDVGGRP